VNYLRKVQTGTWFSWLTILVVASFLRPPIADLGPLIPVIKTDLGLSANLVSIVGSLPTIGFGVGALLTPLLLKRVSKRTLLNAAIIALTASVWLRTQTSATGLVIFTAIIGLTIAIGNTLLPSLVKSEFPNRIGLATGLYTTVMAVTAGAAAWSAVPLAGSDGTDWQTSLAWPAAIGVVAVILLLANRFNAIAGIPEIHLGRLVRSRSAWEVTLFMGMQSMMFYATLTWLPSMLQAAGYSPTEAGGWLSYLSTIGVPLGLTLPFVMRKFESLSTAAMISSAVVVVGTIGLAISPGSFIWLWLGLMGLGGGLAFPLSLAMITQRARTADITTSLSAMGQGFGYLIAALGTYLIGIVASWSNGWVVPAWILVGFAFLQFVFAKPAGSNHPI
jgi:MFS transporter, CP family, cyanate transporter